MPLKGGKRKTRRNYKKKTFRRKQKKRKTRRKSRKSKKRRTRRRRKRNMTGGDEVEKEQEMKKVSLEIPNMGTEDDDIFHAVNNIKNALDLMRFITTPESQTSITDKREAITELENEFKKRMGQLEEVINKTYSFPVSFLSKRTAGRDRATKGSNPKKIKYYNFNEINANSNTSLLDYDLMVPEMKISELPEIPVVCSLGQDCKIKEGDNKGEILNVEKAIDLVKEKEGDILSSLKKLLTEAKDTRVKKIEDKIKEDEEKEKKEMKEKIEKHKLKWDNARFFATQLPSGWSQGDGQEFSWDKLNANNMTPEKITSIYETLKNGFGEAEAIKTKYLAQLFYLYLFKRDEKDGLKNYPRPEYLGPDYEELKNKLEEQINWSEEQVKNIQIKNE